MSTTDDKEIRTVALPYYDWQIVVKLLMQAANRNNKNLVAKHTYSDLAKWVTKQAAL